MFLVSDRDHVEIAIAGELGMHDDTKYSPFEIDEQIFCFGVSLVFKGVNLPWSSGNCITIRPWDPGKGEWFEELDVGKCNLRGVWIRRIGGAMNVEVVPNDSFFNPCCFHSNRLRPRRQGTQAD